jgi:hypothetical protein
MRKGTNQPPTGDKPPAPPSPPSVAALTQQQEQAEPVALTDPLHDDAYLRAIALGFPTGDARRWTLCRIADRIEQTPPRKPLSSAQIRAIEVEVAQSQRHDYPTDAEAFARAIERAHRIGDEHEPT